MFEIFLAFMSATPQSELPRQWAQFSRAGQLNHITETIEVATGDRGQDNAFRYILRRTKRTLNGDSQIAWADSATCPEVRSVIASMRDIPVPSLAPYGLPGEARSITMDGTLYSLAAPSSDNMGKIAISSNVGSPLASWVDASLEQLASCWTATAP